MLHRSRSEPRNVRFVRRGRQRNSSSAGPCSRCDGLTKTFGALTACDAIALDHPSWRNPRASRRERRRQIDARQDALRRARSRRGHHPMEGRARLDPVALRRKTSRHRHGVPAFLAVRGADGCREHRAVAGRRCFDQQASPPRRRRSRKAMACRSILSRMWRTCRSASASASRSCARCCRTRSSIILDEPTSVLTPAGGRPAVRDAGEAEVRGPLDPLYQPSS
jgi:hypothetical protein